MKKLAGFTFFAAFCLLIALTATGQTSMANVLGRKLISLNGKWQVIIDPNDAGEGVGIGKDAKAKGKTDFLEYSFDASPTLKVPGDFNSQMPELTYYESSVWYKKTFTYQKANKRLFLHFAAANYIADVYFNGEKIGSHEGGFTPFQFEITDKVKEQNSIVVRVNNQRRKDGIPAIGYDWFNYGGLTREVNLIETPATYIDDYFIQLKKGRVNQIEGWIKLRGDKSKQQIHLLIPEARINYAISTNDSGYVPVELNAKLELWSPAHPKLYSVSIETETDTIKDAIGFRTIETKGTTILLNGKSVFLKGVNIHEEISSEKRKAVDEKDALQLLNGAKELGCNFVRLTHYPHNEYMVRLADKLGIMLWEEIPLWQGIAFGERGVQSKIENMMLEMIQRDQNRSSIIIWSMSNETVPNPARTESLVKLASVARAKDSSRLIASALNHINFNKNVVTIDDSLCMVLDVVGVNAYLGWYRQWLAEPKDYLWQSPFNKPLIMTEFGAEALYGHHGSADTASNWTEEYQEHVYKDNIVMLKNISFLRGTTPWILYDFRSGRRMNSTYQKGWNRKGLLSDKGEKKRAWYVMKSFYDSIP